jgi:glycosyltransferase involved in cell wall biosynthesis
MAFGLNGCENNMTYNKKRLLLIGGEDVSLRIPMVKMLETFDYKVAVVGTESRHIFDDANVTYFRYKLDRSFTPILDLKTVFELYRLFCRERPDIVHTFDTKPNILGCIAARFAGVPKIIRTINGMGKIFSDESWRTYLLKRMYYLLQYGISKLTQSTIFQNQDDLKHFTSRGLISVEKAKYVPGSGVCVEDFEKSVASRADMEDLREELGISGRCTVLLVSRIIKAKGIVEYLESARAVATSSDRVKFLLVGPIEGGIEGFQKSLIDDYSDVCTYLGYRSDVSTLIALSDIIVLPSYYKEGVPRTLIEGASLSKPLISTAVSGCRDIVINDHNGILVPVKDSKKLSQAIQYLADNPDIRLEMGFKGRELVLDRFSLTKVCEGWRDLY